MAICEWCGKEHDGTYGSGRFCSYECKQDYCKDKGKSGSPKQIKTEIRICERCGKEFVVDLKKDSKKHPKRFCSYQCANVRSHSKETKQKIKESITKHHRDSNGLPRRELGKLYNYTTPEQYPNLDIPIYTCKICGKQFYHVYHRDTCNNSFCRREYNKQLQYTHWEICPRDKFRTNGEWNELAFKQEYKYYFTYKITNLINGKYYLGMHMTNNLNDGYMGSGPAIKRAIKKYGKENFKKDILEYFTCYAELSNGEAQLITEDVFKDKQCYNMKPGGTGGPTFKGHKHTEETKQRIKNRLIEHYKK